jgi:hypothetical protein
MKLHWRTPREVRAYKRHVWEMRAEHRRRQLAQGIDVAGFMGWAKFEQHVMAVETLESIDAFLAQRKREGK